MEDVCPAGLEPATYSSASCCSIQLSYGHMNANCNIQSASCDSEKPGQAYPAPAANYRLIVPSMIAPIVFTIISASS